MTKKKIKYITTVNCDSNITTNNNSPITYCILISSKLKATSGKNCMVINEQLKV